MFWVYMIMCLFLYTTEQDEEGAVREAAQQDVSICYICVLYIYGTYMYYIYMCSLYRCYVYMFCVHKNMCVPSNKSEQDEKSAVREAAQQDTSICYIFVLSTYYTHVL